jgi:hypothetical protein
METNLPDDDEQRAKLAEELCQSLAFVQVNPDLLTDRNGDDAITTGTTTTNSVETHKLWWPAIILDEIGQLSHKINDLCSLVPTINQEHYRLQAILSYLQHQQDGTTPIHECFPAVLLGDVLPCHNRIIFWAKDRSEKHRKNFLTELFDMDRRYENQPDALRQAFRNATQLVVPIIMNSLKNKSNAMFCSELSLVPVKDNKTSPTIANDGKNDQQSPKKSTADSSHLLVPDTEQKKSPLNDSTQKEAVSKHKESTEYQTTSANLKSPQKEVPTVSSKSSSTKSKRNQCKTRSASGNDIQNPSKSKRLKSTSSKQESTDKKEKKQPPRKTIEISIPSFQDVRKILAKGGYQFSQDTPFCRPLEPGMKPNEGFTCFSREDVFRKHLCANGVNCFCSLSSSSSASSPTSTTDIDFSETCTCWTGDEKDLIYLWVRLAITSKPPGNYQVVLITAKEAMGLLRRIGFRYDDSFGGHVLPGCVDPEEGVSGFHKDRDLLATLSRVGFPEGCNFDDLDEEEKLSLELFIATTNYVETL